MKIHINKLLTGMFMLLLALPFVSCNDDDDNGLPVIHGVRTTDPLLKDSTFVKANPGQMLVIEGENLGSVTKVYINGQDVYFNPNYVTAQTIIVTIPEELELTGKNAELPKEIRVENRNGSASYSFHVLSPAPEIKRLQISYPVNAGDNIVIHGENFYEIEKIVMEGENETNVEIGQFIITSAYNAILFRLPEGVDTYGEMVVYCAAGETRCPYATVMLPPSILSISSDMPVIGAEFFITGSYFIDVEKVNINGEYDILADDLRISESNDTIYLKLPEEPKTTGRITITAAGGDSKGSSVFYPIEYVIANFDDVGSMSWTGNYYDGNGQNAPFVTTGRAGGFVENNVGAYSGWFGNMLTNTQFRDAIDGNTPVSNLILRFECFITYPLQTISYQVMFGGDWDNAPSGYVPVSITSGKTEIGKWMTCQIPLSMLSVNAKNYSDVKAMASEIGFFSKNGEESIPKYEAYFDNLRILIKE